MSERYPYAGSYKDRHGRTRWRWRRHGRTVQLPGVPGDAAFEDAYARLIAGLMPAPLIKLPTAAVPRTLRAAWRGIKASAEWKRLAENSRTDQARVAERFLARPMAPGAPAWGEAPLADLKRRHIRAILAEMAETPHAAGHVLRLLRKMVLFGLDEEWIEVDPTHRIRWSPESEGFRAWTDDELDAFEKRWPVGTTPRLVYAIGLCTGAARVDIAQMRWDNVKAKTVEFRRQKTGVAVVVPILPPLAAALEAAPRRHACVVTTMHGRPFSVKALGMRFADWSAKAGLAGTTIHGLRKTLGGVLGEGATAKQIQAALGHTTLSQAQLYTQSSDRIRGARDAFATLGGRFAKGNG